MDGREEDSGPTAARATASLSPMYRTTILLPAFTAPLYTYTRARLVLSCVQIRFITQIVHPSVRFPANAEAKDGASSGAEAAAGAAEGGGAEGAAGGGSIDLSGRSLKFLVATWREHEEVSPGVCACVCVCACV